MGKHYVDKDLLHQALVESKKKGDLTRNAWTYLITMIEDGVIRKYSTLSDDDKQDAISSVKHDLCKYWKGFRESGVMQTMINRNFMIGEYISINIVNYGNILLIPYKKISGGELKFIGVWDDGKIIIQKDECINELSDGVLKLYFEIGIDKNKTMTNIKNSILNYEDIVELTVNKTIGRLTFMDKINEEKESLKSNFMVCSIHPDNEYEYVNLHLIQSTVIPEKYKVDKHLTNIDPFEEVYFSKPSPAFNYFTSFMENAIRKSIGENNPENTKNGRTISLNINENNNGFYNI